VGEIVGSSVGTGAVGAAVGVLVLLQPGLPGLRPPVWLPPSKSPTPQPSNIGADAGSRRADERGADIGADAAEQSKSPTPQPSKAPSSGDEGKSSGESTAPPPSMIGTSLVGSFLGALGGIALIATRVYGVPPLLCGQEGGPRWRGQDVGRRRAVWRRALWLTGLDAAARGQANRFSTGVLPTMRQSTGADNASQIESRYSAFFVNNPPFTVSSPIVKRFSTLKVPLNG
jgi:hypothetical protein